MRGSGGWRVEEAGLSGGGVGGCVLDAAEEEDEEEGFRPSEVDLPSPPPPCPAVPPADDGDGDDSASPLPAARKTVEGVTGTWN